MVGENQELHQIWGGMYMKEREREVYLLWSLKVEAWESG